MHALNKETPVAVIGAGAMGAGIAQVAAQAGHPVRLYDTRTGAAAQAIAGIDRQLARLVEKGKLDAATHVATLARLRPADELEALADAGLVIEAIVEKLEIKRELLQRLEALCAPGCILASNTSSLSITSPPPACGTRAACSACTFNPAPLMALVEIVSGLDSEPALAGCLFETARAWGKQPVHARSTPGFIVNRVARPFYAESLRLLQEGAADCATLDALMREAGGFRMGAFELTDLIGHDVNYAVTCSVFDAYYGDARFQPSLIQKELVEAGRLGRKSGRGFYDYSEGAERPQPSTLASTATVEACALEGDLGTAQPLAQRLERAGVQVTRRDGAGLLRVGDATLALSDGRLATRPRGRPRQPGAAGPRPRLRPHRAPRHQLGGRHPPGAIDAAVALLARAGIGASPLADVPGLAVLRTVAMLANEGADAPAPRGRQRRRHRPGHVRRGHYPRGPLAWADTIGLPQVLRTLDNLQAAYGEPRYRPSLALRRRVAEGRTLHDQP